MPSGRQFRVIGLVAILVILVLYYATNGEQLTHNSEFYKKTLAVIEQKKDAEARQHLIEEEKSRLDRVDRLQKEHNIAMAAAEDPSNPRAVAPEKQKHVAQDAAAANGETEKSVAGRKKMMKEGKIVNEKPASDSDDGVAKVGNVGAQGANAVKGKTGEDDTKENVDVEAEMNDILKKGPIIIFSKSTCPFSKRAKHILLELYKITPAPYVVELDQHTLGHDIQDALLKSTGRRTVPNILINGKSIGGGDDVAHLHKTGTLVETLQSMGGKRILSVVSADEQRAEVKFKA